MAGLTHFMDQHAFGPDRAALLAALIPTTTAEHAAARARQEDQLRTELDRINAAQAGLMTELARLGTDTRPATNAYRERIQDHHAELHDQRATIQAQPDDLAVAATPEQDPTLLDELPYLTSQLTDAPADLVEALINALDIQILYRHEQHQATVWGTLTDTTPTTINALLNDPRVTTSQANPHASTPAFNADLAQRPMILLILPQTRILPDKRRASAYLIEAPSCGIRLQLPSPRFSRLPFLVSADLHLLGVGPQHAQRGCPVRAGGGQPGVGRGQPAHGHPAELPGRPGDRRLGVRRPVPPGL
jgi:hypothetical protein